MTTGRINQRCPESAPDAAPDRARGPGSWGGDRRTGPPGREGQRHQTRGRRAPRGRTPRGRARPLRPARRTVAVAGGHPFAPTGVFSGGEPRQGRRGRPQAPPAAAASTALKGGTEPGHAGHGQRLPETASPRDAGRRGWPAANGRQVPSTAGDQRAPGLPLRGPRPPPGRTGSQSTPLAGRGLDGSIAAAAPGRPARVLQARKQET